MMGFEENMALSKEQQILVEGWLMASLCLKEIIRSPEGTDLDKVYKIDAYYVKSSNVRVTVQEHGHKFTKFLTVTIPTDILYPYQIRDQIGNGEYWEGCAQYIVTVYSDESAERKFAIMVCNFQKLRDYIDAYVPIKWEKPRENEFLNVNNDTNKVFVHIEFERLLNDPKASGIVLHHYMGDQARAIYDGQDYESGNLARDPKIKKAALAQLHS